MKRVGGTIEDTELIDGVVLNQNVVNSAGGPTRMEKAKIAIIQFQLSAPKPDVRPASSSYHPKLTTFVITDGQHRRHQ